MNTFIYTGDPGRYYPEFSLTPEPGKTYKLPYFPLDGRWSAVATVTPAPASETESK